MFNIFKKKSKILTIEESDKDNKLDASIAIATGFSVADSAQASTQVAARQFAKPETYNRKILDDGLAKRNTKIDAFKSNVEVRDPYTGQTLTLTKAEAQQKYGADWTNHLAEADHIIPLEQRYEQTKNNPWLSNEDIRHSSNSSDNLEVVSRKYNNAKRSRSNKDFVTDEEYLSKTKVELSDQGKARALENETRAQKALQRQDFKKSAENIAKTGHHAGLNAAKNAGITGLTMSGILNLTAVIKGEKTAEDAIADTVVDSGKAAVTGYAMGGGLTVVSHTLSGSKSKFIQTLTKSNVPGKIITAVVVTGDTLKRYGNGEISTQECMIELGEKGLTVATTGYSMAVGQALIPIPVVGGAVGALVGSMLTSNYYNQLIGELKNKQLEHQERLRIIAESEEAAKQARIFRAELESYIEAYFRDCRECFDEALSTIYNAFKAGDADGVISGANQITRKLGGKVHYDNMQEFEDFLLDDSTDIL